MAKFYSNENLPLPIVRALRRIGHDVLTSYEAGRANQSLPDEDVLAYACQENRILLTLNRKDFIKLHQANSDHAGIVAITFDLDFSGVAKRIDESVQQNDPMVGKFVRVNRPG